MNVHRYREILETKFSAAQSKDQTCLYHFGLIYNKDLYLVMALFLYCSILIHQSDSVSSCHLPDVNSGFFYHVQL